MSRSDSVVLVIAMMLLAGCREDGEPVSGQPYVCECHYVDSDQALLLNVCALSVGEAMDVAIDCAPSVSVGEPQYCDCLESSTNYCEIGSCSERYQP